MCKCAIVVEPDVELTSACIIQSLNHRHLALLNLQVNLVSICLYKFIDAYRVYFEHLANDLQQLKEHPVFIQHRHIPLATLGTDIAQQGIFCTAPSKTFNLAGLQISNIFIPNPMIRSTFQAEFDRTGYCEPSADGLVACRAGYSSDGAAWLSELQAYLKGNLEFLREYLHERLPKVRLVEPEGTYLVWLDFNAYGLSPKELNDTIVHKAKVWLDDGHIFGADGDGFQRINLCSPRSVLKEAVDRIAPVLSM